MGSKPIAAHSTRSTSTTLAVVDHSITICGTDEVLQAKRFTNNADAEGVAALFEQTATSVLGATTKLELDKMPVRDGDGARVAQALALCHSIQELYWCAVEMPAVEVRELYAPAALQQRLMQALERVMQEAAAN